MPNNVDERVVQMRIDNKQFVKGAEKTINVLDKLKTALSFKERSQELQEFQRVSNRIDLSGITAALETVSDKFTVLGIISKRTIENIADSVYRVGKRMVSGLSIDQVTAGYSKYEQKMKSVQTMMANTANQIGKEYADRDAQLEAINEQMDRLMFFTDETSYDFAGMSNNMASFIAAGVGIRDARIDMQGVAAAAGLAGASVEQANHAMYNLSQAMAMGTLKVQDWNSLEIAKIVTDEFKKTVAETAVECGKLKKEGDDMYSTLDGKHKFSSSGVRSALQYGFVDTEVIEKTLHKYGEFSDVLNSVSDLTGMTATDLLESLDKYEAGELDFIELQKELADYISEEEIPSISALEEAMKTLSNEELSLGRRAFKASQEYNSFNDAINATKDAVSTGWMTTFEYIFGDYLEAKKVWTALGDELYEIFASGAERRNAILELWHDTGGRAAFLESVRNIFDGFMSFIEPVKQAFNDIFYLGTVDDAAVKIVNLTKKFRDFTARLTLSESSAKRLRTIFKTLFDIVSRVGVRTFNAITDTFKEFGRVIEPVRNALRSVFTNQYISSFADKIDDVASKFFSFVSSLRLSDKALQGLEYILQKIFGGLKKGTETVNASFFSKIVSGIGKVITFLRNLLNLILESFAGGFSKDTLLSGLSELFYGIGDWAGVAWDKLVTFFTGVIGFIDKVIERIRGLTGITSIFSSIFGFIQSIFDKLKTTLSSAFSDKSLGSNVIKIGVGLGALIEAGLKIRDFKWTLDAIFKPINDLAGTFTDMLWQIGEAFKSLKLESYGRQIRSFAFSILLLSAGLWILASIDIAKLGKALGATAVGLGEIIGAIKLLSFGGNAKGLNTTVKAMLKLSTAILILSVAMKILSDLDPTSLGYGLLAIGVMLFELLAFFAAMNALKIDTKKIKGLVSMAIAMIIFSGAIAILGSIPYDNLVQGLIALAIALTVVTLAVIAMSKFGSGKMILIGAGLVEIAVAMVILVGAIALLSLVDPIKAANSLALLAAALLAITIAVSFMPATLPLIGAGLVLVAVAIALIAASMAALTLVDPLKLLQSLGLITIALLALGLVLTFFQTAIVGALALLAVGAAMALASVGILVFAFAMQMLQNVPLEDIALGILLVAPAIVALAAALVAMTVGLVGAVALVVAAGGLFVMATALNLLTGLNLFYIADGMVLLGGGFLALGAGALVLMFGVPGMIAGAFAITLISLAMIPLVKTLKMFESVSYDDIIKFLLAFGGTAGILALLTPVLTPLSIALAAFGVACAAAGYGIWLCGEGMKNIADSITVIPDKAGDTFKTVAVVLKESVGEIRQSGIEILNQIDQLAKSIIYEMNANSSGIKEAVEQIIKSSEQKAIDKLPDFKIIGRNIVIGLVNGINDEAEEAIDAIHTLAIAMAEQFRRDFDIHSPSGLMEYLAGMIPIGAKNGIEKNGSMVSDAMETMGTGMLSALYPTLEILSMLLNEEYEFSPVITPVVDMTDVASSSYAIRDMLSDVTNTTVRASGNISSMVDAAGRVSAEVDSVASNRTSAGDNFTINVYSQPGMNENDLANAVMYKIQNGIVRKGAALG